MPSDYSTPDSATSAVDNEWQRGELPQPQPEELERKPSESEPPSEVAPEPGPHTALEAQPESPVEAAPGPEPRGTTPEAAAVETEASPTVGAPPGPLTLEAAVESLLFVADGPVPVARLAEALEVNLREVEAALEALSAAYAERGLSLQRIRDKVQLTTAPAAAERVQRFLGLAASAPLSKAALETLAIIAYQQPVTRPQIDAIRGVNSDSVIKNLLAKGLIEESGRTEGPGRPVLYGTTAEFLQHFGLTSLADLPPLNLDGLRPVPAAEILKG